MAAGKDRNTPGAVISGGNAPHSAFVRAPLAGLAEAAENAGVTAPAVILVGDVAGLDLSVHMERLSQDGLYDPHATSEGSGDHMEHTYYETTGDLSTASGKLEGLCIGITGTEAVAAKQLKALQTLGARGLWILRSDIKALPPEPALRALEKDPQWIVFTSANGVDTFFRQAAQKETDRLSLSKHKFAVIGQATGEALARRGFRASLCPKRFTSEALAAELTAAAKPEDRILLLRSALASSTLPDLLRKAVLAVEDVPIYDITCESFAQPLPNMDYLTFSSSSGVALFLERYGRIPEGIRIVCIGDVTAKTLSQYTDRTFLTAADISATGIVETILRDRFLNMDFL